MIYITLHFAIIFAANFCLSQFSLFSFRSKSIDMVNNLQGIGCLMYKELRKRLQSVGIHTIFCWGDKESEGFWLKQVLTYIPLRSQFLLNLIHEMSHSWVTSNTVIWWPGHLFLFMSYLESIYFHYRWVGLIFQFLAFYIFWKVEIQLQGFVSIGEVDTKGRGRRLPIKANIRRALCFPGGSTLMVSHLNKDASTNPAEPIKLPFLLKPFENSSPFVAQNRGSRDKSEDPDAHKDWFLLNGRYSLVSDIGSISTSFFFFQKPSIFILKSWYVIFPLQPLLFLWILDSSHLTSNSRLPRPYSFREHGLQQYG